MKTPRRKKSLSRIEIRVIPHSDQPYPTVGNWRVRAGQLRSIEVSRLGNPDYEFLVALHELVEAYLCIKRGISQQAVDRFDKAYERLRPEGDTSEPGDNRDAPYCKEHQAATMIELLMADLLGVDWVTYGKAVEAL